MITVIPAGSPKLQISMKLDIPLVMGWIVPLLFFYKDGFGIKLPSKVDMPLNKET